jgi:hypothetical protein
VLLYVRDVLEESDIGDIRMIGDLYVRRISMNGRMACCLVEEFSEEFFDEEFEEGIFEEFECY